MQGLTDAVATYGPGVASLAGTAITAFATVPGCCSVVVNGTFAWIICPAFCNMFNKFAMYLGLLP